jgi:hypothetical protein
VAEALSHRELTLDEGASFRPYRNARTRCVDPAADVLERNDHRMNLNI